MNSPKSVGYGWVAFTVAGSLGSFIGYKTWTNGAGDRAVKHAQHLVDQKHKVEKANEAIKTRNLKVNPTSEISKELDDLEDRLLKIQSNV